MGGYYPELGEVEFMLTWIALEVLANAHAETRKISDILPPDKFKVVKKEVKKVLSHLEGGELIIQKIPELNRPSIREKVDKLKSEYKWDFITDKLFSEWNKLRNHIMHTGTYAGFSQNKLIDLSVQLRDSMQLMLIDLLSCSDYVNNLQGLKTRIRGSTK